MFALALQKQEICKGMLPGGVCHSGENFIYSNSTKKQIQPTTQAPPPEVMQARWTRTTGQRASNFNTNVLDTVSDTQGDQLYFNPEINKEENKSIFAIYSTSEGETLETQDNNTITAALPELTQYQKQIKSNQKLTTQGAILCANKQ